ncbi:MAG: right-handed parallel beta-helix repeat-containing protein, partial [Chthonomonadales bacterium]|nr:right-handed parallel beta-helix repeat-containing protein [Chthonomonadales bacterium]
MTPALLFALLSVQTGGRVYFVAPGGTDANPGSMARPFATIQRAQEAVRAYRKQTSDPHPVTVMIRAGVYRLAAPLTFGKEDSGTARAPALYRAFGSERPTITGGYPVTAFRPGSGRAMAADLRGTALEGADIRVVTYQGKRLEMARYPNRDVTDPHGGRWAHVDGKRIGMYEDSPGPAEGDATGKDFWQRNRPELTRTLRMRADDTRRTGNVRGGEVSVFPRFNWNHYILPILDVEADGRTLRLGEGSFYEIRPGDRYFVRGLRSLLDVPNEWHWDRATSELAWIPPERRASCMLEAARLGNLIELDGASHVALQGLTLECANGSGIVMRNCDNVRVAACTVRNVGDALGDGIVIESGSHNAVVGCDIHDVGNTGIRLGGGDHFALAPGGNRVVNSYIHHVGRVGKHGNGIAVTGAMHTISRNLIHDTPHSGIFMWGSGHTVEFNRIRHT